VSSSEIDTGVSAPEDELVRAELDEARRKRRTGRARIVGTLVSVAVIGAVFAFALPRIADYGDVWDEILKLSWQWLVVLGLATLLNLATYGPPLMAALPGLSYFHASRVTLASTALSVIAPGGAAVGVATTVAMLRARGFSGRPVGLAVVVMSVWNQSVILGFPILAVAGLAAQGARNRTLEIAALVGLAVFAVVVAAFAIALSSERLAHRVGDRAARLISAAGRLLHKAPVKWSGASFVHFRDESIELIRRRWLFLTAATLAGHLTVFVVLVVLTARRRRHAHRGDDCRGLRGVDAGAHPRRNPDHARRRGLRHLPTGRDRYRPARRRARPTTVTGRGSLANAISHSSAPSSSERTSAPTRSNASTAAGSYARPDARAPTRAGSRPA
jgi:uncharacterized membrane protein YbhN (UPF0104 family)